jgi:two-component system sensor histidine kinase ResE
VLQGVHGPTAYLIDKAGQQIGSNDAKLTLPGPDYHTAALFTTAASLHGSGSAIIAGPTAGHAPVVVSYATEPGFQGYAGSGWILALASPVATATTAAFQLTLLLIAVFFIIVAVGIAAIILFVNRSFLRPIRSLSAAVTRITLGDLSQTVPVGSQDELGALGRSFNEMTHQLAATHRGLKATTKAAEEALAQLQSSINGLRQGFILTDAQGKVLLLNAAARDMVRPQGGDKSAHPSLEAVAKVLPESLELIDKVNQTIADRQASKFPDIALSGRFLNLYLSPVVHEDDSIGCVLLLEDITEERILQRSRDEFFSIASHELRTPLTAIRGNTSMIQQYYAEALKDPSLGEMVTDIHESAVRLIEIVNDFLDASRLEQGKMQLTPEAFAIEPVIEKITYEMAGLSRDKKIYLKFANKLGTLPMVYADQNRVKQIIYNLIGNAMKFTDKGGVTITGEPDKAGLKVRVTDTGQGITPEGQQILFHKFQQSATSILTRDNTRGTGLGLYISKLLVEHMGGSIKLESSEAGKGSVFSFTLPLATEEQKKQKPATAPAAATATPAPRLANDQVKPDTKPNDEKAPHPGPKPDAK